MTDTHDSERSNRDGLLLNRRGLLAAGMLALGSGVASAQSSEEDGPENSPFALEDHDHSDDVLGAETPVDEILVDTLTAATANDTHYARPGDVQAVVDEVAENGGGVVRLFPNTTYDAGEEIHVRPGVTLDFDGAVLEITSDHNGLFVDNAAQVRDAEIRVEADSWSSVGILLDTGRAHAPWAPDQRDGKYGLHNETGVTVEAKVFGINDAGRGLELRDPVALGIGLGNSFDVTIKNCEVGVHVTGQRDDQGVAWVNSIDLHVNIAYCGVQIKHSGHRTMFVSDVYGVVQPSHRTRHVFVNETNTASFTYYGHIWDNHTVPGPEIVGPNITVVTSQTGEGSPQPDPYIHGDGSQNQVVHKFSDDFYEVHDVTHENRWRWRYTENGLELELDRERVFGVTPDGVPKLIEESDLSETGVAFPSTLGIDDGTNTSSGKRELAVGQADGTWLTMGGDTIQASEGPSGYAIPRRTLSIDGDLGEFDETDGIDIEDEFDVYSGEPTVDGTTWFAYDDDYLYVAADVGDDQHVQDDNSPDEIWSDDALQVGVCAGQPGEADEWDEIDVALTDGTPTVFRRVFPSQEITEEIDVPATIARESHETRSLAKLTVTQDSPNHWRAMSHEGVTVDVDENPYVQVTVPKLEGNFNVRVSGDGFTGTLFPTNEPGTHTANLQEATGWSGETTFDVFVVAVGYDEPIWIDSLGVLPTEGAALADAAWKDTFDDLLGWQLLSGLEGEAFIDRPSTRYEVALPWDQLTASADDEVLGINAAFHDRDDDTNAWIEWAGGILGTKDSQFFELAALDDA